MEKSENKDKKGARKMTIERLKEVILLISEKYPIEKVYLFGSRADGTNKSDSDVDLIMEFSKRVSLLTLSSVKIELEELLDLEVDIVHGPLRETDLIEVKKVVELYAA